MTDKQPITEDKSKLIEMLNSFPYIKIELKDEILQIIQEYPKLKAENEELKKEISYWKNLHNESLQREDKLGEKLEDYNKILERGSQSAPERRNESIKNMKELQQENDQLKHYKCWKCGADMFGVRHD